MLISWGRLLSGRFLDARVGADVLAGCAAGVILAVIGHFPFAVATWMNLPGHAPYFPYADNVLQTESSTTTALRGMSGILNNATFSLTSGVEIALIWVAILLIARVLVRRDWIAVCVLGCFVFGGNYLAFARSGMKPVLGVTGAALFAAIYILVLFRFGILGLAAALFTAFLIRDCFLTLDFSRWYIWSSVLVLAILIALAIHGFRSALAGRPAFGHAILED